MQQLSADLLSSSQARAAPGVLSTPKEDKDRAMTSSNNGTPSIPGPCSARRSCLSLRLARLTEVDTLHVVVQGLHISPLALALRLNGLFLSPAIFPRRETAQR